MLEVLTTLFPNWTWLLTAVIGLVSLAMVRHLLQVWSLPPGPFPLPILGNILDLRGENNAFRRVLTRLHKKHGDMFTLWIGSKPSIFVSSWDLCHEGLIVKRNDFNGRVQRHLSEILLDGKSDTAFSDYSPAWETLKKVLSTALRKYVGSQHLAELVSDVVDRTTDTMLKRGKAVDSATFMYLNVYNILASSAFGVRYELDDPDFNGLRRNNDNLLETFGNGLPTDALPFLKPFYRKRVKEMTDILMILKSYIARKLKEHMDTYQSGDIRDFTDAVLSAKEEAEAEGKESAQYLTPENLHMLLVNLFAAGTDTTRTLLGWIFLLISNDPEIQKRMQAEVDRNIGSRQPVQKDKASCHYINAVITETLRFRSVGDFSLEHKAIQDTQLGGYRIPKDTSVFFYIKSSHIDQDYWKDPDVYRPERFLDENGQFTSMRISHYMPFGLGRRSCPGEKLALADTFLITARLLQKHNFSLEGGPGSGDITVQDETISSIPKPFKLVISKRDVNL